MSLRCLRLSSLFYDERELRCSSQISVFPNMGLTVKSSPAHAMVMTSQWKQLGLVTLSPTFPFALYIVTHRDIGHFLRVGVCNHFRKVESSKIRNWL